MHSIHLIPVEGRVPYGAGLKWQRDLARAKIAGELDEDFVLLLEHEPVVTLGRGARREGCEPSSELLSRAGIETFEVERGGDVTYHGPGQLVGYPILDLNRWKRDLHWYLRQVEQTLIHALAALRVSGFRYPGLTGVWVGDETALTRADRAAGRVRKIASIGVHVSRWVTWHGFALNVTEEPLENFGLIVPCGIDEVRMTALRSEGAEHDRDTVTEAIRGGLARAFACDVPMASPVRAGEVPTLGPTAVSATRP